MPDTILDDATVRTVDSIIEMMEYPNRIGSSKFVLMTNQETCWYCNVEMTRRYCVLCGQPVCGRCDLVHGRECA